MCEFQIKGIFEILGKPINVVILKFVRALLFHSIFILVVMTTVMDSTIGQSSAPDHIVLTWKEDPMNSQSVSWRTEKKIEQPLAQIMEASAAPYGEEKAKYVEAYVQQIKLERGKEYFYYSATFKGLLPGKKYCYRVGGSEGEWSPWTHFQVATVDSDTFSFIYLGDVQNDILSWGARSIRAAYAHEPGADFTLFAGDCVNDAHRDGQWMEWFDALGYVTSNKSIIPVTGNHEYDDELNPKSEDVLSVFWPLQFELPLNGPKGLEESAFFMDYKSMRLVVLNSTMALRSAQELEKQTRWLEATLSGNSKKWTVVTFHHALFSARDGNHGDYPKLRDAWLPVLEKHKVDLVLMGHDHVYGRSSRQMRTIEVPEGDAGPVYVVSVAGPKMYGIRPSKRWMERAAVNTQMYQTITIEGDYLKFRAYTVLDELYDSFDLKKQKGKYNKFVENISSENSPEIVFPHGGYTRKPE